MKSERFDRQIRLFGKEGQSRIEQAHVGVVGAGGLGSHVIQQLAYLGSRSMCIIDGDTVTESSLNRLVGATREDLGVPKVAVADRLVRSISPDAKVIALSTSFLCDDGIALLRDCDYVFGCVDSDAVRFVLNEFCQAFAIPYFDLATDVEGETATRDLGFGGRLIFSTDGELCLACVGVLNEEAVRMGLMNTEQRAAHESMYGVPLAVLAAAGPAVVSLNGILASIGVTEFMVQVTGIRAARRHVEYHGMRGIVAVETANTTPDCHYCKGLHGGRAFDLMQYAGLFTQRG